MIEDRCVYAARRFTSIESSFQPCDIIAIVPGAYPGESKMWLKTLIHFTKTVENQSLAEGENRRAGTAHEDIYIIIIQKSACLRDRVSNACDWST